ncbi:hypothetical protein TSAR_009096 [Trichomalopsis sarcophagae]|uniref:C2H2-type domain-containing protein n=1 Tax=Trichomalopsis sarcophagae TaxID=543379 RepID=A0A232FG12_9HYME|nr:hypothetical protein TSAR_009096 [Trichomalopsis sarcophagae]
MKSTAWTVAKDVSDVESIKLEIVDEETIVDDDQPEQIKKEIIVNDDQPEESKEQTISDSNEDDMPLAMRTVVRKRPIHDLISDDMPLAMRIVVRKRLAKKPKKHQSAKPVGTGKIHNAVKRKARLCCIPCGKDVDLNTVGHYRAVQTCKKCWRSMSFVCISCGSKFSYLFNTYIHLKTNCKALPAKFHCPKCSYKSKRKRHIKEHMQFMHSAQKCRVCGKKIKIRPSVYPRARCIKLEIVKRAMSITILLLDFIAVAAGSRYCTCTRLLTIRSMASLHDDNAKSIKLQIVEEGISAIDNDKRENSENSIILTSADDDNAKSIKLQIVEEGISAIDNDKRENSENSLIPTSVVVSSKTRLLCGNCKKDVPMSAVVRSTMQSHCLDCQKPLIFACTSCTSKCSTMHSMYTHLNRNCDSIARNVACPYCKYEAKQDYNLRLHIERQHEKKCKGCGASIRTHAEISQHLVSNCPYKFEPKFHSIDGRNFTAKKHQSSNPMQNHNMSIAILAQVISQDGTVTMMNSEVDPLKLEIVDEDIQFENVEVAERFETFSSKDGDDSSLAAGSTDKKPWGKTWRASSGMMISAVTEKARLYCKHCDKYTNLTNVAVNINSRFNCDDCSRALTLICTFCESKISHLRNMYMHLKRGCKMVAPRFPCTKCSYKAKERTNLRRHIENKHSVKKCPECGEKINTYADFLRHQAFQCSYQIDLDSLVGVLRCNLCDYFTKIKCNLSSHMRSAHKR